jgi:tripartite-type tricarboxylate transporter receptor subunit TctC
MAAEAQYAVKVKHCLWRGRSRRFHRSVPAGIVLGWALPADKQPSGPGEGEMHFWRRWRGPVALSLTVVLTAAGAGAQSADYPSRPVTIISDAAAGASPDVDARFVAEGLTKLWKQQVVVVNRPGANGSIAARAAADAAPDGYTLFHPVLSTFISPSSVAPNLPVKLPRDFLPIGFTAENPMFIAVSTSLDVATLPQLIALAKKQPDQISIAVTGVGRMTHLTGVLLQDRAGIKLLPVPYNGGPAAAVSDLAAGRVSMAIEGYGGLVGAVKAGSIKLIAVASAQRLPDFPELPTVSETIPDFTATGWQVMVAPLGTPQPIIDKVSADLMKVMSDPDIKTRLAVLGTYTRTMTPDQVLDFVGKEQATWLPIQDRIGSQVK